MGTVGLSLGPLWEFLAHKLCSQESAEHGRVTDGHSHNLEISAFYLNLLARLSPSLHQRKTVVVG